MATNRLLFKVCDTEIHVVDTKTTMYLMLEVGMWEISSIVNKQVNKQK